VHGYGHGHGKERKSRPATIKAHKQAGCAGKLAGKRAAVRFARSVRSIYARPEPPPVSLSLTHVFTYGTWRSPPTLAYAVPDSANPNLVRGVCNWKRAKQNKLKEAQTAQRTFVLLSLDALSLAGSLQEWPINTISIGMLRAVVRWMAR